MDALQSNKNQSSKHSSDTTFFFSLTVLITAIVFSGFISNWIVNPDNLGRMTIWIGLHGAFSATWYLVLINQIRLSKSHNMNVHRLIGKLSALLVGAIVISGLVMTFDLYERLVGFGVFNPDDPSARIRAGGLIGSTVLQWGIFAVVFTLGIIYRHKPAHHKRFMLASAIQMMPEGINRLIHLLALPGYTLLVIVFLIYVSLMIYDWKVNRRLHSSSVISFSLFVLLATSIYTLFRSQFWGDWVVSVL